jgi:glycosyltransferase involved in cell wall biosynthesis
LVQENLALDTSRFRRLEPVLLSAVVPCFDEELVIRETHARLVATLERLVDARFEILYVDDGSRDGSLAVLRTIQRSDARVRVISLSRNFGQQIAVAAGLEHAAGDAVVLIDADLQDPPEVIPEMVERWRAGVDVVYGARTEREGETALKLWTAKTFCRTLNRLSDVDIPLDTGDFRLMDRKVVDALLAMPERDRFVRGMVAWVGFRQEPVHYSRAARFAGRTKYPLKKMLRFASDGILSFSLVPLRLAIYMGFAASGLALAGIVYALLLRLFTDAWVTGWTLLFIAVLFLGGVQLVFLGVIGEYVGRVYGEVKQRPLYLVKERLGFADPIGRTVEQS